VTPVSVEKERSLRHSALRFWEYCISILEGRGKSFVKICEERHSQNPPIWLLEGSARQADIREVQTC